MATSSVRDERQPCCAGKVLSEYESQGEVLQLANSLPAYCVGSDRATKAILVNYDIFGFEMKATRQFCDKLAHVNDEFLVVMADYFRGNPWTEKKFPITDREEFMTWIGPFMDVSADVATILDYLKQVKNIQSISTVGTCYGGKIAICMAATPDAFKAVCVLHGSFVDSKDAEALQSPLLMLDSITEPDRQEFNKILQDKPFADKCFYKRFNLQHGWSTRGDRANSETDQAMDEAFNLTAEFLMKNS